MEWKFSLSSPVGRPSGKCGRGWVGGESRMLGLIAGAASPNGSRRATSTRHLFPHCGNAGPAG